MQTNRELFESVIRTVQAGRRVALCAVVKTRGSAPQEPGAMMLVDEAMNSRGTLGGGCVEAEVRKRAHELLGQAGSGVLEFVLNHDYGWDDGLICGGRMDIAVETIQSPDQLDTFSQAVAAIEANREATVAVHAEREGEPVRYEVVVESRPTLLIAGAGHVGQALARLAADVEFRVIVIDDRADCCNDERFPTADERIVGDIEKALRDYPLDRSTYVTIVTRGHQHDEQALAAVIGRPARYIGLIGSRRKSKLIFDDLIEAGTDPEELKKVHTPIGVAIHAVTVPESAVSIAAELIAVRRESTARRVAGPFPAEQESAVQTG